MGEPSLSNCPGNGDHLISKREQTKRRHGPKKAREDFNPIRGSLEAERALEIVQIDHTPTDVMGVEPDCESAWNKDPV
ncbi:hypothetical protein [Azospirillum argentinense]